MNLTRVTQQKKSPPKIVAKFGLGSSWHLLLQIVSKTRKDFQTANYPPKNRNENENNGAEHENSST